MLHNDALVADTVHAVKGFSLQLHCNSTHTQNAQSMETENLHIKKKKKKGFPSTEINRINSAHT